MADTKGVVLIALGHHYYGKMAAGLCATLKAIEPTLNVTLFYSQSAIADLSESERNLFNLVEVSSDKYSLNGYSRFLRPKLLLHELSPYDTTIYLDVDMVWLGKPISELFAELENVNFTVKNYGAKPLSQSIDDPKAWAKYSDIALIYNLTDELNFTISSEFIYFKKTDEVKALLEKAVQVFDNPKIDYREFAGYVADELALSIAIMCTKTYPHKASYEPIWWVQSNIEKPTLANLREKFYAISMGGVRATTSNEQLYNILVSSAYYNLNIKYPHKWVNKHRFLQERKKI